MNVLVFLQTSVFSFILSFPNGSHTHNQLPHGGEEKKKQEKKMEMTAE